MILDRIRIKGEAGKRKPHVLIQEMEAGKWTPHVLTQEIDKNKI